MVLGISVTLEAVTESLIRGLVVSLSHEYFGRFADDIGERVKATSVSHTHNESLSTELSESINAELESGDEGPVTLEIEPLDGVELFGQEISPGVGPVETLEHVDFLFNSEVLELQIIKLLSDPLLGISVAHVHEFNSDLFAVGVLKDRD
jgi:hypothetical protein